jgi:Ala-tRNA(Pro) deacylase
MELLADPGLLKHPEIYFNAARLDRSFALDTADYVRVSHPRVHPIAAPVPQRPAPG